MRLAEDVFAYLGLADLAMGLEGYGINNFAVCIETPPRELDPDELGWREAPFRTNENARFQFRPQAVISDEFDIWLCIDLTYAGVDEDYAGLYTTFNSHRD